MKRRRGFLELTLISAVAKDTKMKYEEFNLSKNADGLLPVVVQDCETLKVLMVAYPVRGLDINSSYTIFNLLNEQKEKGAAVIFVGEDLDVLLELCDKILVICGGQISGVVDARTATKEEIGILMTKHSGGESNES